MKVAAAVVLAATIVLSSCGEDPALQSRLLTRPDAPDVQVVRTTTGPAVGEMMVERYIARIRWAQVSRWSKAAIYAAAVHRARYAEALASASGVRETGARSDPPSVQEAEGSSVWQRLAQCESGGDWSITVGTFEGGLQFLNSTWLAYGGGAFALHAYDASPGQQIAIAEKVLAASGGRFSAWPGCRSKLGLP